MTSHKARRFCSSPRFRWVLALGLAATPVVVAWGQAPDRPREEAAIDPDTALPESALERARERAERARRDAQQRAARERRAREAELKALTEQLRERNKAIEEQAEREAKTEEGRRRERERGPGELATNLGQHRAEVALVDLRIETTKEVLKAVWKRVMEAELQQDLRGEAPDASRDPESLRVLRVLAERYEQEIRQLIQRKTEQEMKGGELERQLDRSQTRLNRERPGEPSSLSVARSVDYLLGRLKEEGAIDDDDRRQLNTLAGAIEELLNLFRDSGHGHDEPEQD